MLSAETQYLNLLHRILDNGEKRENRTGTGTIEVFAEQLKFDVGAAFPLLTTKKVAFKPVLSELLWFLEGSKDERRLAEILHGTRDPEKKTIWSPNAEFTSGSKFTPEYPGDLGKVYGYQWRSWTSNVIVRGGDNSVEHNDGSETLFGATVRTKKIDQMKEAVWKLKNNPTDRRIIVSAWNPGELDQMALPPCHLFMQFYLTNDKKLHCQMYQRSVDTFLGLPFNMASYAALMYIIAAEVGAMPGILTMCLGATHIYMDHIEQVKEQLSRTDFEPPRLRIVNPKPFDEYKMDDFLLLDYNSHPPIKAKMAT